MKEEMSFYGKKIIPDMCPVCGSVCDLEVTRVFNEQKTKESIKKYIIDNSSVMEFSSWNGYYDFNCAGLETMQAYSRDCNKHKEQVKEFLENYSEDELLNQRCNLSLEESCNIPNSILSRLGYEFKEG